MQEYRENFFANFAFNFAVFAFKKDQISKFSNLQIFKSSNFQILRVLF
jgi:hypothetical protein